MKSKFTFILIAYILFSAHRCLALGNFFTTVVAEDPQVLNPLIATSDYANDILNWTCDSLLKKDFDSNEWKEAIAEKWTWDSSASSIVFKIRKNIYFHNGDPITLEDIKFSFEIYLKNDQIPASIKDFYKEIKKVEILSENEIKIEFKSNYFKNVEVAALNWIVPKKVYSQNPMNAMTLICSGPYKLESWEKNKKINLIRFDKHYSSQIPYWKKLYQFEGIEFLVSNQTDQWIKWLRSGSIDFLEIPNSDFLDANMGKSAPNGYKLVKAENKIPKAWSYVGWNMARPIFSDLNVRRAMNLLVNRKEISQKFFDGKVYELYGPVNETHDLFSKLWVHEFDLAQAQKILDKAGWKDTNKNGIREKFIEGIEVELKFTLLYANRDYERLWNYLREQFWSAGILMEPKYVDFSILIKNKENLDFDAVALSWAGGGIEIDPRQLWHSESSIKGGSNFVGYKSTEVDKLIDQGRIQTDRKKRNDDFKKALNQVVSDQPYLFLFMEKYSYYLVNSRIQRPRDSFNYSFGLPTWSINKNRP